MGDGSQEAGNVEGASSFRTRLLRAQQLPDHCGWEVAHEAGLTVDEELIALTWGRGLSEWEGGGRGVPTSTSALETSPQSPIPRQEPQDSTSPPSGQPLPTEAHSFGNPLTRVQ